MIEDTKIPPGSIKSIYSPDPRSHEEKKLKRELIFTVLNIGM